MLHLSGIVTGFTVFGDVLIAEHEDDLLVLDTEFVVENFQIFAEGRFAVTTAELDFEDFTTSCKGGQTSYLKGEEETSGISSDNEQGCLSYGMLFHCHRHRLTERCLCPFGSLGEYVSDARGHRRRELDSFGCWSHCTLVKSTIDSRSDRCEEKTNERRVSTSSNRALAAS